MIEIRPLDLAHRAQDDGEPADNRAVVDRIRKFSLAAWMLFATGLLLWKGWWAWIGLTCSALIAMINFLWLEEIVVKILRPVPQVKSWRLVVRAYARFILFGVALSVAIFIARFDPISVILGFSIIVIGIVCEGAYGLIRHSN